MKRGPVRRMERLEAATHATDAPHVEVIELDEKRRPSRSVAARADGRPVPVIILPALRTPALEDVQIMAVREDLRQRGQH